MFGYDKPPSFPLRSRVTRITAKRLDTTNPKVGASAKPVVGASSHALAGRQHPTSENPRLAALPWGAGRGGIPSHSSGLRDPHVGGLFTRTHFLLEQW